MIKQEVLSRFSSKRGKPTTRLDIQKYIWVAQGKDINVFRYRQGYYGDGIQSWVSEGLIERVEKGKYILTKDGKRYVKNPRSMREINKERRFKNMKRAIKVLVSDNKKMRREIYDIGKILNRER
jgi:hypothetical protein